MKNINRIAGALLLLGVAAGICDNESSACTRVVYEGLDSIRIVGRSLDWKTPIPTNLYVYPAGISKKGDDKPGCVEWTSKYGAVYAVSYDGGVTEGMNEKGLVINGLFCKGTVYNGADENGRPPISLAVFVAWLLDMNATTDEVVAVLHPGDQLAMTNDPEWPKMNAILDYWDKIGGTHALPGTVSSPDRCVRANFFAHHVEKVNDPDLAVAICKSVIVPSCVPYTYLIGGEPNVSSTQWRSYSDIRGRRYFFDIVTNPGYYYIDLNKCNLRKGASVMKFNTSENTDVFGDVTLMLQPSAPFTPMY